MFKKKKQPEMLKVEQGQKEKAPLPPPPQPPEGLKQPVQAPAVTHELIFQGLQDIYTYLVQLGDAIYYQIEKENEGQEPPTN